jgi:hypothetical protein
VRIEANEARFDAVRRYLTENFPEADIPAPQEFAGAERVFCVEDFDYSQHQLELGRSIYEDRSPAQLVELLEAHDVAQTMRANPEARLVVAPRWGGGIDCSVAELRS